jgi:Tryptophan halogenase
MSKMESIVVVGGGSSGWMSAATFAKLFPNKKVTVIESPDIPIVGVGESTLGGIRDWMYQLGIEEHDFMEYTNAAYKLSIKFTDFYKKDSGSFHYPFGRPYMHEARLGLNSWHLKKALMPETSVDDYARTFFPGITLAENNKFNQNLNQEFEYFNPETDAAYHFDATLFGAWLRDRFCIPLGVNLISLNVEKVNTGEDGIESLVLSDGSVVTADLFIDCTGWKSLLLGQALEEPFDSYTDMLPNNRAWATQIPYTDPDKEMEPYTNCTALGNGWAWNIPLWSRIGTGYVYSDKYVSKEDALDEFKNYLNSNKMTVPNSNRVTDDLVFKDIEFRVGIHKRTWVKNVVAIGLAAGFIEPLESNGLYSVHVFLLKLIKCFGRDQVTQWDKDVYNGAVRSLFNELAEFVALHYALTNRDDTEYWRDITNKTFSNNIVNLIPTINSGFMDLASRKMFILEHNIQGGMHCIATGMHYELLDENQVRSWELYTGSDYKLWVKEFLDKRLPMMQKWKEAADESPTLYTYLKDKYKK